jgi:hypothetical protein
MMSKKFGKYFMVFIIIILIVAFFISIKKFAIDPTSVKKENEELQKENQELKQTIEQNQTIEKRIEVENSTFFPWFLVILLMIIIIVLIFYLKRKGTIGRIKTYEEVIMFLRGTPDKNYTDRFGYETTPEDQLFGVYGWAYGEYKGKALGLISFSTLKTWSRKFGEPHKSFQKGFLVNLTNLNDIQEVFYNMTWKEMKNYVKETRYGMEFIHYKEDDKPDALTIATASYLEKSGVAEKQVKDFGPVIEAIKR